MLADIRELFGLVALKTEAASAVNDEILSGNEVGFIEYKEVDHVGDIFWLADAAQYVHFAHVDSQKNLSLI